MTGGLQPVTRTLWCAVDARALRDYVATAGPEADEVPRHKDGQSYGATRRELAGRVLGHVQGEGSDGLGRVRLQYRHSRLGAELIAAGHVLESREYAIQRAADPFSLPRALRELALGRTGSDFDDAASFPRAKHACVAPCRRHLGVFLAHRERIFTQMGDYAFSDGRWALAEAERRSRMKMLFSSLDMDGTLGAWRARVGLRDNEAPLADFVVDLGQAGDFRFAAYRRVQRVGTGWLARQLPAMSDFVVTHLRATRDARRLAHPERTVASYVFQEAEGISRPGMWCTTCSTTAWCLRLPVTRTQPPLGASSRRHARRPWGTSNPSRSSDSARVCVLALRLSLVRRCACDLRRAWRLWRVRMHCGVGSFAGSDGAARLRPWLDPRRSATRAGPWAARGCWPTGVLIGRPPRPLLGPR